MLDRFLSKYSSYFFSLDKNNIDDKDTKSFK